MEEHPTNNKPVIFKDTTLWRSGEDWGTNCSRLQGTEEQWQLCVMCNLLLDLLLSRFYWVSCNPWMGFLGKGHMGVLSMLVSLFYEIERIITYKGKKKKSYIVTLPMQLTLLRWLFSFWHLCILPAHDSKIHLSTELKDGMSIS